MQTGHSCTRLEVFCLRYPKTQAGQEAALCENEPLRTALSSRRTFPALRDSTSRLWLQHLLHAAVIGF